MSDYLPVKEKAHPVAKQFMAEDFYWSPIEQTAPFGSDDGADTFASFNEWRQTHKKENLINFLNKHIQSWGYPTFDILETNLQNLKSYLNQSEMNFRYMIGIDAAIVAIAFGQLYLEGTIDKDFKEIAKKSIQRELIPDFLSLWGEEYKIKRESQLNKMFKCLTQVQ